MLGASSARAHVTLSIALAGEEPPAEFRIFTAGEVVTTKGTFTFDEASAKSVMADYVAHGIDLMIDYDHASLASITLDPALAGKAAGWFNIELRGGELWAVNVRWTQPAADALRRKEWRFMSPAFATDEGRVVSLMNVAITNLPATRRLEPLMAASVTALGDNAMSVEEFLKVCKALGIDLSSPLEEAMAKIKGEPAAEDAQDAPADAPADAAVAAAAPAVPTEEDKPAEVAAALSAITSLSGKGFVASVADIRTWHASHVTLATERKAIAEREAILDGAERRKLCVEFVTLGGRAPATVWADDASTTPKAYLLAMPMADLRSMHADAIKANGGKSTTPRPPTRLAVVGAPAPAGTDGSKDYVVDGGKVITLTALDHKYAADSKCDPAVYATLKARREASKT